jgi:hypothetical protein
MSESNSNLPSLQRVTRVKSNVGHSQGGPKRVGHPWKTKIRRPGAGGAAVELEGIGVWIQQNAARLPPDDAAPVRESIGTPYRCRSVH